MRTVKRVNDCLEPTWEETERLLLKLREEPSTQVSMEAGDDIYFVIEYVQGSGYFMSGCGPQDRGHFNLVDFGLGDEITPGVLADNDYVFPRYALVGPELLLRAAKAFFEMGVREPTCEWVPEEDAFYR